MYVGVFLFFPSDFDDMYGGGSGCDDEEIDDHAVFGLVFAREVFSAIIPAREGMFCFCSMGLFD